MVKLVTALVPKSLDNVDSGTIVRAMPGISSMLPKGGDAIWGNLTWAPDDLPGQESSYGSLLKFAQKNSTVESPKNLTIYDSMQFLMDNSEDWYRDQVQRNYSYGVATSLKQIEENDLKPSTWSNPLESRLPFAPSLKIYCFYGRRCLP